MKYELIFHKAKSRLLTARLRSEYGTFHPCEVLNYAFKICIVTARASTKYNRYKRKNENTTRNI
jgi:hypothetical protein